MATPELSLLHKTLEEWTLSKKNFHRVDARHQHTPEISLMHKTLVEWISAKNFTM
jgi:hypothetical protein